MPGEEDHDVAAIAAPVEGAKAAPAAAEIERLLDNRPEALRQDRKQIMPLIAGRRGPPILRRGMIVLVIRQRLSRKQVALSCAAALVNGAAADPHRAGLVRQTFWTMKS